jgi:hypothetical protein
VKSVLAALTKAPAGGRGLRAASGSGGGGDGVDRVAEELLLRGLAHVLDAEETLVGGVLEQAADEVGHAGEQFADGAVLADAVAHLQQRGLQFVGHAVERLELVGARIDAEALGLGDGVGDERTLCEAKFGVTMSMFSRRKQVSFS